MKEIRCYRSIRWRTVVHAESRPRMLLAEPLFYLPFIRPTTTKTTPATIDNPPNTGEK
jgi:hypothetical protein